MQLFSKCQIALGTGIFGLFAGIAIACGGFRDSLAKTISIAGGAALPAFALTHFIVDTRATRKINESERRASDAIASLESSQARLTKLTGELEAYCTVTFYLSLCQINVIEGVKPEH